MSLKHVLLLTISLFANHIWAADDGTWSDVTSRFITNPNFDNNSQNGWSWESDCVTQEVRVNCISFFDGQFVLRQTIKGLPKGHYRLSVQGFYRTTNNENAYPTHQNGSEDITAELYADTQSQPLQSLYSFSFDYNANNRCYTPDNRHYYPNGKEPALTAFDEGAYANSVEFDADGDVVIGVRCQNHLGSNYCALDNFKLEYKSPVSPDGKAWVDMTAALLTNPDFADGTTGWTWTSNASSQKLEYGCMEFWSGNYNFYQDIKDAPKGTYRLSVQGYYRTQNNTDSYNAYKNNTENITGYLYGADAQQKMVSVYSEEMASNVNGSWSANWYGPFFPNTMETANSMFEAGKYWNSMEFAAEGNFRIGVKCNDYVWDNWCIFDNFKLEFYGDIIRITGIDLQTEKTELILGEKMDVNTVIAPANATLTWLEWSSSNERVATVNQRGQITAVGEGTAIITATATDGSGTKGSITIQVRRNQAKEGSLLINEIMASNVDEYVSPAYNFDGWMELYNPTDAPVELNGLTISDPVNGNGPWVMPASMGIVPAKGFRTIWFDSNDIQPCQPPFKLDVDGGTIVIADAQGNNIVTQAYPASLQRVSYARATDGTGVWGLTATPTPGASNQGIQLLQQQLAAPTVDQPSQLFSGKLTINVGIPAGCTLRYTTDGSLPTWSNGETSKTGQFTINATASYRFRLFADGVLPSDVTTRSYIYKYREYYLPIVSVVTDDAFLNSSEMGVMAKGPNGKPGNGQSDNCNWNMNWERPVNFSFITADNDMALNQDVNLEISGGWSRAYKPHSIKLKGDKELGGDKNLPYPFFTAKPYIRNRTVLVRNGGNDSSNRIKDPALQQIAQTANINLDFQSYMPVHEFINGEYKGVLNLREPNNKHYVYANYGWDDEDIDMFEMSPDSGYVQKDGTAEAFEELVDVLSPNAADSDTYAEICRVLDIDAYINYMAMEFYLCNWDWPQNNVKGFRHRDKGKFRFVVFDLDNALSDNDAKVSGTAPFETFFNKQYFTFDKLYPTYLPRITAEVKFVTLFKNMLQNSEFKRRFIDTYCLMGGSVFEKNRVENIVNEMVDYVEPAMNLSGSSAQSTATNVKNWLKFHQRNATNRLTGHYLFGMSGQSYQEVTLNSDTEGAKLYANGQEIPTGQFSGHMFQPMILKAQAPAGYQFKGWKDQSGTIRSTQEEYALATDDITLTATFQPLTATQKAEQGITPVRINEISGSNDSYIDEYGKKGDWMELYNTTSEAIDIEGMYLSDDLNNPLKYTITKGSTKAQTIIPAHGHLVVWIDNKRETTDNGLHVPAKIGSNGGYLTLMAADRSWKDVMVYSSHDAQTTIGRYPDGTAEVYAMNVTTIGKPNILSSYMTTVSQNYQDPTSLGEASADNGLRICYGAETILVRSENDGPVSLSIYRVNGQLAEQMIVHTVGGKLRQDISHLSTGFYVARVTDSNGTTVSCKFMK